MRFDQGAQIPDSDVSIEPERPELDRFTQYALIAAREAVKQSGLPLGPAECAETAVVTGSCVGGRTSEDAGYYALYGEGKNRVHPLTVPRTMANAGASAISLEFGITGPALTISTACASANHAIGYAHWMVRHGMVDAAITGGSESPFSLGHLKAWEAMRVVSEDTCRPFSLDRSGMILGEGAAMIVLEPYEVAEARGIRILGEVVGFGMSSDAHHITQPSVAGPATAMRKALEDASVCTEQIGYINAHGTGTIANDSTETSAIREVFGSLADRIPVSSTKSLHGHTLGAAGAIEAAAALMGMNAGMLPPTANFTTPDPACDLDVISNVARPADVEYALSNSFAFGGLNAVLVLRRGR